MTGWPGACRPGEAEDWVRTPGSDPWSRLGHHGILPSICSLDEEAGGGAMPTGEAEMGIYCPAVPASTAAQAT